jgi:uncharacterized protein YndB with AHSA1/START domain
VAAPPAEVWSVVSDPRRLPLWWPGITRVEEATELAWTTVMTSAKGRGVRADFTRLAAEPGRRLGWRQELAETPFERILHEARTELELAPAGDGTQVELALVQRPRGWARLSPLQLRRAARRQVDGALERLAEMFAEAA